MSTDKLQVFKQLPFLAAVTNCTEQADAVIEEFVAMVLDALPQEDELGDIEYAYNDVYDCVVGWLTKHCPLGAGETVESIVREIADDFFVYNQLQIS